MRFRGRSNSFITDKFHGQYLALTACPICKYRLRKFCTFTVLHVGPHPCTERIIDFTRIEVCGNQRPKKYALKLSSNLKVEDLYREAAKLIDCKEDRPSDHLCFVLNSSELVFLQPSDPLERIKYDRVSADVLPDSPLCLFSEHEMLLLYSYTGCEYGPTSGGQKACFIHQRTLFLSNNRSKRLIKEKREFGYPLVLWLPRDETYNGSLSKKRRTFQGNLGVSPGLPFVLDVYTK